MKKITFYKMSGSGNDFIIVDNRNNIVNEKDLSKFIENVCRRRMSVGADGLIFVENSDSLDFKWRFFNSDGNVAEMCGNGARCVARFAFLKKIAESEMSFETEAGPISARVTKDRVKIKVPNPSGLETDYQIELENGPLLINSINTGVPHVVVEVDSFENVDIVTLGRELRFHKKFAPVGTNVNFVCRQEDGTLAIRTYERGVEDETLACGTGSIACAIVMAYKFRKKSPIKFLTRSGGYLTIHFKEKEAEFYDIQLEGDARIIYKGELWGDAWKYKAE